MPSPMMQQFEAAKARCPGALVLFRMGDFYELFGDDAREAAELLDLTLTSRDKGPDALPMAGFPFHQLDNQLVKLVAAGRHVAICEQIDDPKTTKGLLRREVTRIITPGLAADEALLEPQRMNFLVAVRLARQSGSSQASPSQAAAGIAWIDVAAGRMEAATVDGPDPAGQIAEFLMRLDPAECLCGESERAAVAEIVRASGCRGAVTVRPDWWFSDRDSQEALGRAIQGTSTEGLGFELPRDLPALAAAGGVVLYLEENEPSAVARLGSFHPWRSSHAMEIDESTRRGLELLRTSGEGRREGSLLGVLDRTRSPMGARLLSRWIIAPLVDAARIADRLDAVGVFVRQPLVAESLARSLAGVGDMERITGRIVSGRAGPRDLERIGRIAAALPDILEAISPQRLRDEDAGLLATLVQRLDHCGDIAERIGAMLDGSLHGGAGCPPHTREGGYVRAGYDPRLDELREMATGGKEWIARYQAEQIERTGIASLKVGFNRVFGFFLEVGRSHADKVPPDYVRKQTVKNAERYTTSELEERQRQVLGSEEEAVRREAELFEGLRSFVAGEHKRLDRVADVLATLDVLVSLAEVARSRGWCRPEITERKELLLEDGRHPVLEELLPAGQLVPNDLELAADTPDSPQLLLVTGPNMGGKSTFIRQAALAAVMAQAGSWVPAKRARIGIVDRLFARIGAGDDLARGSSTFLVEMSQAARILNRATSRSLVILDEVGRGTSTFDGLAIAQAVVEHIHDCLGCRTLFATHYLQLAALERLPGVRNVQVLVERHGDSLVFLHRVTAGAADRSWGIHVAKLAGVPPAVIDRAAGLLASFEADPPPPRSAVRKPKPQPTSDDDQLPLFSP
jgi:DNA mismatch repair protein MutS